MPLFSKRKPISIDRIKSGMLLEFKYTKLTGEDDTYTILVVDPKRKNDHAREPQVHAYLIDDLDEDTLIEFMEAFTAEIQLGTDEEKKEILIEELNTDDSYFFFLSSQFAENRMYRTFNRSKMRSIKQILIGPVE